MLIDAEGFLNRAQLINSPNCDQRPGNEQVSLLVIHNISLPPEQFDGDGVIQLFINQIDPNEHPYYQQLINLKVSSHFFVRRSGKIIQFVSCNQRAWHAGTSCWNGRERCNDFSIGIELEGSDHTPFTDEQYDTLTTLTQCLCEHYPIVDIAGHADIAPGRKTDPGPYFNWQKFSQSMQSPTLFNMRTLLNKVDINV